MIQSEYVEYNVIFLIVATFDLFHPAFDLFICKAHIVFKVFCFHFSQVNFYVADYGAGHGIDDGQDVVDQNGTARVGSVDV